MTSTFPAVTKQKLDGVSLPLQKFKFNSCKVNKTDNKIQMQIVTV